MSLLALGINHESAPVSVREKVVFDTTNTQQALQNLLSIKVVKEAAVLSTCNRTEIYCRIDSDNIQVIIDWLHQYYQLDDNEITPYLYTHTHRDAIVHMMRVASGLNSLILGEPQILGQMKDAHNNAVNANTLDRVLTRLFQHIFKTAKQVRTDTSIGSSPVSVAFAAVALAKKIFGDLSEQTALMIGAGQTIELASRHLNEAGIKNIIVANRTVGKAHELADQFQGYAITLEDLPKHLSEADIVISSTASPIPVLGQGTVQTALKKRRNKPMFMVDIAVPRDIEEEVSELDDVYLYTVDDLQEIIQENQKSRENAAEEAREIIEQQADDFLLWLNSLDVNPVIHELRQRCMQTKEDALEKARKQINNGDDPLKVIETLANQLTNKLIHTPSAELRHAGEHGQSEIIDAAKVLFKLPTHSGNS